MLTPERHGDLEFVTVHADRVAEAVERIKANLPDGERTCPACEYEAAVHRWGIKTYGTTAPDRNALVLCCPSCEAHIDLPIDFE